MQSVAVAVLIAMILSLAAVAVSIIAIIDSSGHGGSGLTSTEITEIQNLVTNVQIVDGVVEAKGFSTAFSPPSALFNATSADPATQLLNNQITLTDDQGRNFTITQDAQGNGVFTSESATQFGSPFGYFKVTTAERLALAPTEGMSVLDTDANAIYVYVNGAWTSLSSASISGTPGQIDVSGNTISLADFGPGANSYTLASITLDAKGRIASAANGTAVLDVSGTANEIDVTAGVHPVVSLDPAVTTILTSWDSIRPMNSPALNNILQYNGTRLAYIQGGNAPFASNSRSILVDKSGNDTTGNGTTLRPFLTIKKALTVAMASTTASNQTCIYVNAGNYIEDNSAGPINIACSGITLYGESSRGVIVIPSTLGNDFFSLTSFNITICNMRFEVVGSSTAACWNLNGALQVSVYDCVFRLFSQAFLVAGTGTFTSSLIVNTCTFVQNNEAMNVIGCNLNFQNNALTGALAATPSSSFNGIVLANSSTLAYISNCIFVRCNNCVASSNGCATYISASNFVYNIGALVADTAAQLVLNSLTFSNIDTGQVAISITDSGTALNMTGCTIDGFNAAQSVTGTGLVIDASATADVQSSTFANCLVATQLGTVTASRLTVSATTFSNNTTSIHLDTAGTLIAANINIDDVATITLDDTTNVKLSLADTSIADASFQQIGPLANTNFHLLDIGTSSGPNNPYLAYATDMYGAPSVNSVHPTTAMASTTLAAFPSFTNVVSRDLTSEASIQLLSDTSSTPGDNTQTRGWRIYKAQPDGELTMAYRSNGISPTMSETPFFQLDGPNALVNVYDSKISWHSPGDTNLYRLSAGVLKTDGNLQVAGLSAASRALTVNGSKQLTVSTTTDTELAFVSGVTSAIQTQLNGKVGLSGVVGGFGTMTGQLIGYAGTVGAPGLAIGTGTNGMYASTTNNVDFATAGAQRVNINAVGTMTVNSLGTGTAGVVHASTVGTLSTSLIVNADITNSTITNAKLAEASSANTNNFLVQRDGSGKFTTTMITLTGTVTNDTDAATKAYVDTAASAGLVVHPPVRVIAVANVSATGAPPTIDGVDNLTDGDRVLLTAQSSAIDNGVYVVNTGGDWDRGADFKTGTAGAAYFLVQEGDVYASTAWVCSTPTATIDTDPITFSQFSQASPITGANVGTGTGQVFRDKTVNTLNFKTLLDGTYTQIANNADDIKLTLLAASANTASYLVARDGSGNFSASQITATGLISPSLDATATTLLLGTSSATAITVGSASIPVTMLGNSKIPVIDGNTGTLALGTNTTTTAVSVGRSAITTSVAGILSALGNSVIPVIDGNSGTLSLGSNSGTSAVSIGRSAITTTISGTLAAGTTGVGALTATSITCPSYDAASGTLTVGASTAAAITLGSVSIPVSVLGNSKIPTIDGNSGALNIGSNTSTTSLNLGRAAITTTIAGTLSIGNVTATSITCATYDFGGAMTFGGTNATSISLGNNSIQVSVTGVLRNATPKFDTIDALSSGALTIGPSLATSVVLGSASIPVSALGNSKIPVIDGNSGALALGTNAGTLSVFIGRGPITTTINGSLSAGATTVNSLTVTNNIVCAVYDTATAVSLLIGTTTCSGITLGSSIIPTTISGNLTALSNSKIPTIDGNTGTLALGTTSVVTTAVSIGRSGITTSIAGTLSAGTTGVGALTATSVTSNTYDAASGTLTIGASTAAAITLGSASIPVTALGNSKIPTIDGNSGALSLGVNSGTTSVSIGRSGITTAISGTTTIGSAISISSAGAVTGVLSLGLTGSALSGLSAAQTFDSSFSDGNYINFGGAGRNIAVDNNGSLWLTKNVDWDATNNVFKYTATAAAKSISMSNTDGDLGYAVSGTAGNTATFVSMLNWTGTSGVAISGNLSMQSNNITNCNSVDSAVGLSIGTSTATSVSIGRSATTTAISGTTTIGTAISISSAGAVTGVLSLGLTGSALSGLSAAQTFSSSFADGNYISVGGGGRNIGVLSSGDLFLSTNADYNATTNVYKYNGTSSCIFVELNQTNGLLRYAASGTAGNTATPSTAISWDTSGNVSTATGNLTIDTAGKTLKIKQGSNACAGTGAVLSTGTVTVNTTAVATGDIILLSCTAAGGTQGIPRISSISNATSFTITSSSNTDTSTYSWVIVKAA